MHAPMDAANGVDRSRMIGRAPERQRPHRPHRPVQARDGGPGAGAEFAVFGDSGRNQRMRSLEQDGPGPAQQHHPLGVDLASDHAVIIA